MKSHLKVPAVLGGLALGLLAATPASAGDTPPQLEQVCNQAQGLLEQALSQGLSGANSLNSLLSDPNNPVTQELLSGLIGGGLEAPIGDILSLIFELCDLTPEDLEEPS